MTKIKLTFLLWLTLVPLCALQAQETAADTLVVTDEPELALPGDSLSVPLQLPHPQPIFWLSAPGFDGCMPWYIGTYGPTWQLHEGWNAQLGMSVSVGLGKHAPSGAGFGQQAAFAYAVPLNKRFSLAAGLYVQNMDWGPWHQNDVGLAAVLGYQLNDYIRLYGYGTKSFLPRSARNTFTPFPLYQERLRDRIGGMVEFKVGEQSTISFSVEAGRSYYPTGKGTFWKAKPAER